MDGYRDDLSYGLMIVRCTVAMGLLETCCIAVFVPCDGAGDPGAIRDDLIGGLLFIPAAVGLLLAIDNMGHAGWSERMTLVYVAVAVASLAAWVWRELRVPNPHLQVRLLARHVIDRQSVVKGKSVSVRVALRGRRVIKTKKQKRTWIA